MNDALDLSAVEAGLDLGGDGSLRVVVSDNGIGMSAEHLKSAFKAFERGSDPFVRASEGVGLGLAAGRPPRARRRAPRVTRFVAFGPRRPLGTARGER